MPRGPDLGELNRQLTWRLEAWLPAVLSDVRREGVDLRGVAQDGTVIKVCARGPKRGTVLDTSDIGSRSRDRRGGSPLNLIKAELGGGSLLRARREAERLLSISPADAPAPTQAEVEARAHAAHDGRLQAHMDSQQRIERVRALAHQEYGRAQPAIGSPAEAYLYGRGVTPAPALRFAYVPRRGLQ
jgi:hypothetical protein